jgi:hypothetical protein
MEYMAWNRLLMALLRKPISTKAHKAHFEIRNSKFQIPNSKFETQ